jgi:hypothetical protein
VTRALALLPRLLVPACLAVAGCGGGGAAHPARDAPLPPQAPGVGPGPRFRPPSLGTRAARALPVAGMRCERAAGSRFGVHLELFAARRVVLVAPGIGVAPPRVRRGAYVRGGRCSYAVRTREPTGVVEVSTRAHATLGQLFAVWGQPLGRRRMAGFRGPVRAYVGGRRRPGDPRSIPLGRHAQIVLEVGGFVRPHASYRFPAGL